MVYSDGTDAGTAPRLSVYFVLATDDVGQRLNGGSLITGVKDMDASDALPRNSDRRVSRRSFQRGVVGAAALGLASRGRVVAGAGPAPSTDDALKIWDLHCHLSGVDGESPEERAGQLLTFADRMGIERLVFFMGFPWSRDPSPADFRRENDQVLRAIRRWPDRTFGFAYLNPKYPDACLDELNRCVRDGPMVGVKLWVTVRCNDPRLDPIIERCAELGAVIFQHTWLKAGGNPPGESTPMDVAELAARHPKVPMICGHTGGDWELGIRAIRASERVSIGTGGSDPTAGLMEMATRELGPERVIYASDVGGRSFASQLAKVHGADLSLAAKRQIFGGNLRRMMQPILRTKGIDA